ncbi:hypothetical protein FOMPIDRAFT_1110647 [Fomitopsis schrenkii]|uniref:Ribosomal protein S21 n=1 Tax=Fomitopsis schrenkii TaxID=2126942 RepID=S8EPD0_FOMSC|nr:hypothetical protein FOMPIDRAFT_1110647 [Fomitopsis schrenkii]
MQATTRSAMEQITKSPEELWQSREGTLVAKLPKPQGPYDGRSAWVHQGDVASAFARINRTIMTNRIVPELRQHARHERAGAKRNRLTSERWRRRFAHEVRMKVKLVQEIRARGA